MKAKKVYNLLIEALGLKTGDKIVITTIYSYFSKSIKKGRPVKLTYVPEVYELFKDSDSNYYFKKIVTINKKTYYTDIEYNYTYPYLLFNNFEKYEDAKYTKKTVEYYKTREDYYKAYPNTIYWRAED